MQPLRRFLIVGIPALMTLPGCAAVGAIRGAAEPLDSYTLTPASLATPMRPTARHIVVQTPVASGALNSDRIVVMPSRLQVQYLAGARWVDPVPDLVQSLLTESLGNTGAFRFVGRTTTGPLPDYTILTEIHDFQAETTGNEAAPIVARVKLSLALMRESDGTIVASRRISAVEPAADVDAAQVVAAFNAATDKVLEQAVAWILSTFGLAGTS